MEMTRICITQYFLNDHDLKNDTELYHFDGKYCAKYLQENLSLKPVKSLLVSYQNKLINLTHIQYIFLDFTWNQEEPTDIISKNLRQKLINGFDVEIQISPKNIWKINHQSKIQNLLLNSRKSITTYFITSEHEISEKYNELYLLTVNTEPFTGIINNNVEKKHPLVYRDSYIEMFIQI